MSIDNSLKSKMSGLITTWRLHILAALWLPAVGAIAFGLSRVAPDGEAERGVVLAVIALGGYKLSEWAIDILGSFAIERGVWPLLSRGQSSGSGHNAAFSSAVRMLHHSGRNAHFSKQHELQEEMHKLQEHLKKIEAHIGKTERRVSDRNKAYASLTPRRHVSVPDMFDLSSVLSDGDFDESDLRGTVFKMPDGTFWQASIGMGNYIQKVGSLDGQEGSDFVLLTRVGK